MRRLVLIFVSALLAAACGGEQISEQIAEQAIGGDVDVEISEDGDEVTVNIESDDGSLSLGVGASLPDELVVPVPGGGDVGATGSSGESVFASITYPGDRYDEIVAFYDAWTEGTGDEWQTQSATIDFEGQTQRSNVWSSADSVLFIALADCGTLGGDFDSACVTINQS